MPANLSEFRGRSAWLKATYLTGAGLAFFYITASVVVTLWFRTPSTELEGPLLSMPPNPELLVRCHDEVNALSTELPARAGEIIASPAQTGRADVGSQWQRVVTEWQRRWERTSARCRFDDLGGRLGVAYDRLARVHGDLPGMRLRFSSLMRTFDKQQADRLASQNRALARSRAAFEKRINAN